MGIAKEKIAEAKKVAEESALKDRVFLERAAVISGGIPLLSIPPALELFPGMGEVYGMEILNAILC